MIAACRSHNTRRENRKKGSINDRNTKSGRGGRGHVREGKRAFDRHSGTGRRDTTKKGGDGAHNWGSDRHEAEHYNDEVKKEEEETPTETPEPEINTISYEDYLASKQRPDNEVFQPINERKGDDDDFFSKGKGQSKVEKEEDFFAKSGGKQKRERKQKDVDSSAVDLLGFRAGGRGDGGRGRGRGRGGREGRGRGRNEGRNGGRGEGRGRGRGRGGRDGGGRGSRGRGGRDGGRGARGAGRGHGRGRLNVQDEVAFPSL